MTTQPSVESLAEAMGNLQGRDVNDDNEWWWLMAEAEEHLAAAGRGEIEAWWEVES